MQLCSSDAHHPGFADEYRLWVSVFNLSGEAFPEPVGWSDDMVQPETVQPKAEPVGRSVDDMVLCLLVFKIQFWDVSDAEETEVLLRPAGEIEPVVVSAGFVLLCFFEERVVL